jgi:hypothetical protein
VRDRGFGAPGVHLPKNDGDVFCITQSYLVLLAAFRLSCPILGRKLVCSKTETRSNTIERISPLMQGNANSHVMSEHENKRQRAGRTMSTNGANMKTPLFQATKLFRVMVFGSVIFVLVGVQIGAIGDLLAGVTDVPTSSTTHRNNEKEVQKMLDASHFITSFAPRLVQCDASSNSTFFVRLDMFPMNSKRNSTAARHQTEQKKTALSLNQSEAEQSNTKMTSSKTRPIYMSKNTKTTTLIKSKRKKNNRKSPDDGCVPMYNWQTQNFPSCNTMYENSPFDIITSSSSRGQTRLLAHGYYRFVWLTKTTRRAKTPNPGGETATTFAFKTIQLQRSITPEIMNGCAKDALISERLTASPHIVNIYGYCGTSSLYEFAGGGDLELMAKQTNSPMKFSGVARLETAISIAAGLAALHSVGGAIGNVDVDVNVNFASIAHADLKPAQFVFVKRPASPSNNITNGDVPQVTLKLSDFNLSELLWKNVTTGTQCKYYHKSMDNKVRI